MNESQKIQKINLLIGVAPCACRSQYSGRSTSRPFGIIIRLERWRICRACGDRWQSGRVVTKCKPKWDFFILRFDLSACLRHVLRGLCGVLNDATPTAGLIFGAIESIECNWWYYCGEQTPLCGFPLIMMSTCCVAHGSMHDLTDRSRVAKMPLHRFITHYISFIFVFVITC